MNVAELAVVLILGMGALIILHNLFFYRSCQTSGGKVVSNEHPKCNRCNHIMTKEKNLSGVMVWHCVRCFYNIPCDQVPSDHVTVRGDGKVISLEEYRTKKTINKKISDR